jgi:predicted ATPase
MITEVTFENFKSIRGIKNLKFKPLTLITGANSVGKSNILEGIELFAEAARLSKVADEPNVNLSRIFTRGDRKKYPWRQIPDFISFKKKPANMITVEINVTSENSLRDEIDETFENYQMKRANIATKSVGYGLKFRFSDVYFSQYVNSNEEKVIEVHQRKTGAPFIIDGDKKQVTETGGRADWLFNENTFTLSRSGAAETAFKLQIARTILDFLKKQCENIFLISGERGNIDAELPVREGRTPHSNEISWVGSKGQYVIEVLSRLIIREPEKADMVREWAGKFQVPEIRAGYVGEGKLESNFMDKQFNIGLNSALAGLGSRQILSIIVQIFSAEPGSVIMIEEPEISLHPEKQVLLHELFAKAISQGKQIVCTTHSPFLVLAVSSIIRKKLLKLDDIVIYHAEKDREGTKLEELKLNEHGFLVSGVPSFMKVERELFQEWSQTLEEE